VDDSKPAGSPRGTEALVVPIKWVFVQRCNHVISAPMCLSGWRAICLFTITIFGAHSAHAQSSWTQLSPSGTPPIARTGTSGVYDSASDRMIVFGGRDGSGNNRNDVWVLTHANGEGGTGQWIRLIANGAAGSPPARSGHSAVYDSTNNRMIIFGGCADYCAPVLNDVWVLTNANGSEERRPGRSCPLSQGRRRGPMLSQRTTQ
jgi:hypothetical protein